MRTLAVPASDAATLADAYAWCERFARSHYENFPVASLLLPRAMRPHVAAIYAFARIADDFADEPGLEAADRLRLLEFWGSQLPGESRRSDGSGLASDTTAVGAAAGANEMSVPVFTALRHTIDARDLPVALFRDLLSAFRQDVTTKRYAAWTDVLDYCRRSANPVGRLVLRVAGCRDARLHGSSDALCTALQLTNFWQDLERDWAGGRLYVPLEDCERLDAREEDLDARRLTPAWQSVLAELASRTRELFARGRGVADGVRGRLGWELRLTWLGGMRILERLEAARFDVFGRRPTLRASDVPGLLWGAVTWRAGGPTPR